MGLTNRSVGWRAAESDRPAGQGPVIALAGNPNVGKSTLFNALTGLNQHTGNWAGKTVTNARGVCTVNGHAYTLVDIPGTYSLTAHSAEEEVARDFICFAAPHRVVVVCDATCLERNLTLVLQIMETGVPVVMCVNLMDEAARKGFRLELSLLQQRLGVPVIPTVARKRRSLETLLQTLDGPLPAAAPPVVYPPAIERAVAALLPQIPPEAGVNSRWLALRLLEENTVLDGHVDIAPAMRQAAAEQRERLAATGLAGEALTDAMAAATVTTARRLCRGVITRRQTGRGDTDRTVDRVLTGRYTAYPLMLLLLAVVFWLTIAGADYPSQLLADALFWVQDRLTDLFTYLHAPDWLHGALVLGVYRMLAWVVSVMLPPMAIFFPLFTILEDVGYLPRIAYNLDRPFHRCHACGKQALTLCMGFGCNAAGVVGCRIIDSPRERLLAILTNSFVPCNGRFPTLITLLTLLAVGAAGGLFSDALAAGLLTAAVLLGIGVTLLVTRLLAVTVLKGTPSSFTLELPPYRRPQIGRILVRSVLDRTLFVLGRAVAVAAPAGLVIWLLANITVGDASLLVHCAAFLDPLGTLMGMDGAILLAFILGFPAGEVVLPLILMTYMAQGVLQPVGDLAQLYPVLREQGWTWLTVVCTALFSLFHWPCSTTLLTIHKETGSWKWTALTAALPTAVGAGLCLLLATVARLVG